MTDSGPRSDFKPRTLRRWARGDPLTAVHLDEGVEAINRIVGGVSGPSQVRSRVTGATVAARQFRIVEVHGDYVLCSTLKGDYQADAEDDQIYVAKPYLLRRTPFDGSSRDSISYSYSDDSTRTATDSDSHTEEQAIVPSYVVGDIIYAARGIEGGTGVVVSYNERDNIVDWLDLNADGRAWAAA